MDPIFERIKPNGDIRLPKSVLEPLKLKAGEKVMLNVRGNEIHIKPAEARKKNITKRITGSIKLHNPKLIDEIINSEDWL